MARNTIQRAMVLEAARQLDHPTAEQVYLAVRQAYPSISKGTVYRNLGQLVEQGILRKVDTPSGAQHFDITQQNHYHIHCSCCGKVADASLPWQSALTAQMQGVSGYVIDRHDINWYGLCPDCQQNRCNGDDPLHIQK